MNINTPSYKRAAGCAAAIVLFFLIAALYFAPQFSGQTLMQHDVQQYEGMSKDILDNRAATGEDAQWTGRMFGGMPAFLINVKYPAQAVKGTIGKIVKVVDTPASFLFFSMTAMWIAMLLFGLSPWVGLVAALAYGFSTYFMLIIGAGHITKMWALVYAPLMMAGVYCTLRRNAWAGAALTALFTSLEIGANHPQITYYFVIAMAALWISEGIIALRSKRGRDFARRTALLVAAGVAAVGSNFAPLWYTWQHTKETTRGGSELVAEGAHGDEGLDLQYATAWSYSKTETLKHPRARLHGRRLERHLRPGRPRSRCPASLRHGAGRTIHAPILGRPTLHRRPQLSGRRGHIPRPHGSLPAAGTAAVVDRGSDAAHALHGMGKQHDVADRAAHALPARLQQVPNRIDGPRGGTVDAAAAGGSRHRHSHRTQRTDRPQASHARRHTLGRNMRRPAADPHRGRPLALRLRHAARRSLALGAVPTDAARTGGRRVCQARCT
ncbi:MAG: hypothetical protein L6V80_04545 [Bacteroidales bacterium]|nr:MAG: hypothetical protein L6V80_04545 [Bacteroidales bacterium]